MLSACMLNFCPLLCFSCVTSLPCPPGITCHFCRQKKLCGEDGCPRCSRRSTTAECIGKSDCARCHSAMGRFCRACLLIRYGQTLEVGGWMGYSTRKLLHCRGIAHMDLPLVAAARPPAISASSCRHPPCRSQLSTALSTSTTGQSAQTSTEVPCYVDMISTVIMPQQHGCNCLNLGCQQPGLCTLLFMCSNNCSVVLLSLRLLQDVREQMAAGTWLCPHCYEEEHPEEGWMCNSSICMKRRGFKPTGIAIYDAQQRGFPSVAHWLQAQLIKSNNTSKAPAAAAAAAAAAATSDKAVSSSGSNAASAAEEDEEAEVTAAGAAAGAAATAATRTKGRAATKAAAAAAELGSQESRQDSSTDNGDAAVAAAVAPSTPLKTCEGTPGPGTAAAAAAAEGGAATRRTTRSAAGAAAGGNSKEGCVAATAGGAAPSSKRACVGESAGTRRSLRFRR